ncbi:PREDICTED: uncharacterized protein LOC108566672 isoform X1 [Nicrophorus vespilloides]|uniref:Uncharacterized protein LOC108566672 isoform X1 n=1 Tax=Nicrophorus vespilloides TaxID=110193 RepID=A0ABM1N5P8_NICVS|nr:PREDICTED: uncharacterized protein LOC108566672 isoform X1 [Nicrophorus vespilloides]
MYDFFKFAFFQYLTVEFMIRKRLKLPEDASKKKYWFMVNLPSYFLTPAIMLFTLPLLLVFMLIRKLVDVALKKKHGLDYLGLLDGYCTLPHLISVRTLPNAINELHCIESFKKFDVFFDEIVDHVLKTVWSKECYDKLLTIRASCFGYLYLKRHNLDVRKVISKVNSESLNDFLQECNNADLPADGRFNWDMKIASIGADGKYYLFIRLHHCIADGTVMYNLVSNILYKLNPLKDVAAQEMRKKLEIEAKRIGSVKRINKLNINYEKPNIFNVSKSYKTNIVYKTYHLLPIIDVICKNTNTSFQQVVLTAFGAAISNYMEANKILKIPKKIGCGYPKLTDVDRTVRLFENRKSYVFGGRFAGTLLNIPIDTKCSWKQRLDKTGAALERIITSYEIPFNAVSTETFIENLPTPIGRLILKNYNYSGKIFNIEGGPALQLFNGDKLLDKVIFFPKVSTSGFGFTFTNYNNKLQMSLTVSQEQPNVEASQGILNETANNISLMLKEFTY